MDSSVLVPQAHIHLVPAWVIPGPVGFSESPSGLAENKKANHRHRHCRRNDSFHFTVPSLERFRKRVSSPACNI
jgi:hypothetical protein